MNNGYSQIIPTPLIFNSLSFHRTPIAVDSKHSCGEEGEYILNEGICAVRQIGLFWGLDK